MNATLTEVILQLQENNSTQEETNKGIQSLIRSINKPKKKTLDQLETERESGKSKGAQAGEKFAGMLMDPSDTINKMLFFANPLNLLGPLLGGLTALSAAFVGFRGWELKWISKVTSDIADFGQTLYQGAKSMIGTLGTKIGGLATSILRDYFGFGLLDEGGRFRDPETGRFVKRPVFYEILSKVKGVISYVKGLFGFADDLPVSAADEGPGLFRRILNTVGDIFKPIKEILGFATDFMASTGKTLIEPILKAGRTVFQKILFPIGMLFSAFEGVKAFMAEEGTLVEKLGAGFGGALGDFFGAPFDLLKTGMNWLLSKLFGVEIKDGKYDESTIMGKILNLSEEFSITDAISGLVKAPFKAIQAIIDFVGEVFTDPKAAFENLISDLYGEGGVMQTMLKPFAGLIGGVLDLIRPIKDKVVQDFKLFALELYQLPDRMIISAKEMWVDVQEKLTVGFIKLGAWFSSIPARVYAAALETIRSSGKIGRYIVSEEDLQEAKANVAAKDSSLATRIDDVAKESAAKRQQLEEERQALDDQKARVRSAIVDASTRTNDQSTNVQNNNINTGGSPNPFDVGFGISTLPG